MHQRRTISQLAYFFALLAIGCGGEGLSNSVQDAGLVDSGSDATEGPDSDGPDTSLPAPLAFGPCIDKSNTPNQLVAVDELMAGGCNLVTNVDSVFYAVGKNIRKVSKLNPSGGIVIASGESPCELAIDEDHIYWADMGAEQTAAGSIWQAGLDGSNPEELVSGQYLPCSLAVDDVAVYWTTMDPTRIMRFDKTSHETLELAKRPDLLVESGITVNNGTVYFDYEDGSQLYSVPRDGGSVSKLGELDLGYGPLGSNSRVTLIVKDATLYVANLTGGIVTVPIAGGDVGVFAYTTRNIQGIAIHGSTLYWADALTEPMSTSSQHSGIYSAPLSGGQCTKVASQRMPTRMVADDSGLYWRELDTSSLVGGAKGSIMHMDFPN